jgi:flagellar protein FliL
MSQAQAATAGAAGTDTAAPKSRKMLWLMLAVLALASGAGGGGWWWMQSAKAATGEPAAERKPAAKPLFSTLEPFTVNLRDERGERFAQIGVTLQFEDPAVDLAIKDHLPEIEELLTPEGKQQLAAQVRSASARAAGLEKPGAPNPVREVLFSQFLVQ